MDIADHADRGCDAQQVGLFGEDLLDFLADLFHVALGEGFLGFYLFQAGLVIHF